MSIQYETSTPILDALDVLIIRSVHYILDDQTKSIIYEKDLGYADEIHNSLENLTNSLNIPFCISYYDFV